MTKQDSIKPDWTQLANRLTDAPDKFLEQASAEQESRAEQRKRSRKQKLADGIKAAFYAAKGCPEYEYLMDKVELVIQDGKYYSPKRTKSGTLRVPHEGNWMYVCVEGEYWRHKRVDLGGYFAPHEHHEHVYWHDEWTPAKRDGWSIEVPTPSIEHSSGKFDYDAFGYSVKDCKRELLKHHPDKGGDPEQAKLWTKRLNVARRAAS
jgi:hypothetical protein